MKKINALASDRAIHALRGRVIKYPSLIRYHSMPTNSNLMRKNPDYVAVDIETDYITGETRLIGCFDGAKYWHYEEDFLSALLQIIEYASGQKRSIVYWSHFDPLQLFRVMLLELPEEDQHFAIDAYQKITGTWNRKSKKWTEKPVLQTELRGKKFGVSTVIRGNLSLFLLREDADRLKNVWTYNIAPFYAEDLKETAKQYLPWYSKIDEESHLLTGDDWRRFRDPGSYRSKVLLSNEYDAKAAYFLARKLGEDFAAVFYGFFPKSLISVGALGRAAIAAYAEHVHEDLGGKEKVFAVADDLRSLGIRYHVDAWKKQLGDEVFKDFYAAAHEVYKGAMIECYGYGYFKEAVTSDRSSAYPSTERELLDLRGSVVDVGFGIPPQETPESYVFIRGNVSIPDGCEIHPFLIRKPGDENSNLCPCPADVISTYWRDERNVGTELNITFSDEIWYRITTTGQLSVFAGAIDAFTKERDRLRAINDPNELRVKQTSSAGYGIRYEATAIYRLIKGIITFDGLRGGDYLEPISASRITMKTRVAMVRACMSIKRNGGSPIFIQTDAITWEGKISDLDSSMWREKKTIGFFEKPSIVKDLISLGAGRYEYTKFDPDLGIWGDYVAKSRGVYMEELLDSEGVALNTVRWRDALRHTTGVLIKHKMVKKIVLRMKILVTPGMVSHIKSYKAFDEDGHLIKMALKESDIGRIIKVIKQLDPISGRKKRHIEFNDDPSLLSKHHYWSGSVPVFGGMVPGEDIIDDTLPDLRRELMATEFPIEKPKDRTRSIDTKTERRTKYFLLRRHRFTVEESRIKCDSSWPNVMQLIKQKG